MTTTLDQFIATTGLRMTCKYADRNPHMADNNWAADHWRCTITGRHSKRMTVYFSKGMAHKGAPPTLEEVLDCIASDAAAVEQADFAEFAADMGYDSDSRKAERIYKTCVKQARSLRNLLADENTFQSLLYGTDRR